jgi:hypothetical protein
MQQLNLFDLTLAENATPVYSSRFWEQTHNGYVGKFEISKREHILVEIYSPKKELVATVKIVGSRIKAEADFCESVNRILENERLLELNNTNHLTHNVREPSLQTVEHFFLSPHLLEDTVREQVSNKTSDAQNIDSCVREQVKTNTKKSAPEHTHWAETYWTKRGCKRHSYYRYCWMERRKIHHCHISGGHVGSQKSEKRYQEVLKAIALGRSPTEIVALLKSPWQN